MRSVRLALVAIAFAGLLAACPGPGATAHAQDADKCQTNTQGVCAAEPVGTDPDASVNISPAVSDPTLAHVEADRICVLPNSCPAA